ncbi:hypothetical protein [Aquitalea aquatica]|uniref:Uncharacterized protein n=1 Tax=Aquitalea aquatica TaxID=3044273 RepID=A0A838Y940_9NEIS|nr:hypothetical protein [Aquitalea magnusonii]MBA4709912.1 hypothetical protein [Aquitalea magnusonii]
MRNRLLLFLLGVGVMAPALAANVGISVNIGEPGFYGQLDIGNYPPPPLLYPQPVIVSPVVVAQPPIYLRVPAEHARHWDRYCRRYQACDRRVYFVQDKWYRQEFAPRYQREHPRGHDGHDNGWHKGDDRRGNDYRGNDHRNGRPGKPWPDQPGQGRH